LIARRGQKLNVKKKKEVIYATRKPRLSTV
jgi:hypothetical protein